MNTEELRKVAEAATPGPWFVCRNVNDDGTVDIETGRQADWPPAQNCEFPTCHHIAAFNPETAIALLDRIAALEAERAAFKAQMFRFHDIMQKHGLHPGRTDDDLLDILDAALKETP